MFVIPASDISGIFQPPASGSPSKHGDIPMLLISRKNLAFAILAVSLVTLGSVAIAQQNKDSVKVPDGLALSEFKGYEKWQVIGTSQSGNIIDVIVGNPQMIAAYQSGL